MKQVNLYRVWPSCSPHLVQKAFSLDLQQTLCRDFQGKTVVLCRWQITHLQEPRNSQEESNKRQMSKICFHTNYNCKYFAVLLFTLSWRKFFFFIYIFHQN